VVAMQIEKNCAIGVLEFSSIPLGMKVMNQLAKNIELPKIQQQMISNGRYIGILYGTHGSIDFAMNYALDNAVDHISDIGWLGSPSPQLTAFLKGELEINLENIQNIYVMQMPSHARLLETVNDLLQHIQIDLIDINVKAYLDGSSLAIFSGGIAELQLIKDWCSEGELITNLDPKIKDSLVYGR